MNPRGRRFTFPASRRLRRPSEFRRVYDGGRKRVERHLVLWYAPAEPAPGRLGVVASRRVGNAVRRARCKRRLRELYRLHQHRLSPDHDLVFVSRAGLHDADWGRVREEFLHACRQAGLLTDEEE